MKINYSLLNLRQRDLLFLSIWFLIPLSLRIGGLFYFHLPSSLPDQLVLTFYSIFLGGAQDFLIAFFVLGLYRFISQQFSNAQFKVDAVFYLFSFLVMSFLIFDVFLFKNIGIRMTTNLIFFFLTPGPFLDSAIELGLFWLVLYITLLTVLMGAVFLKAQKISWSVPVLKFSPLLFLLFIPSAFISLKSFPPDVKLITNNVFVQEIAMAWAQGDGRSIKKIDLKQELALKNENSKFISPDFPLLRETSNFIGEKQFKINLKKNERPHVIFLFMESFRAKDIGVFGSKKGVSSKFDQLSKKGILFDQFYANGIQTTRAVLSSLFGVLPRFTINSVQSHQPDLNLIGIQHLLKNQGYSSHYFHNGSLKFAKKERFFKHQGFDSIHGKGHVRKEFPEAPRFSWGLMDEYLMRYFVRWMETEAKQDEPLFSVLFSVSNHHPWGIPKDFNPSYKGNENNEYDNFLKSFNYSDSMIGLLVDLLEESGLAEESIIFILADTAQPMGDHNNNFMLLKYLYEENVRIPLLILAPGRIDKPKRISTLGSQVDLLPTLMDILQLSAVHHSMGTSLMRKVEDRPVYFNNPFGTRYLGFRRNNLKYVLEENTGEEFLFNLNDDPGEFRNLINQFPNEKEEWNQKVTSVQFSVDNLIERDRLSPSGLKLK